MMNQVKTTLRRSRATLVEDALGAAALAIMLLAALYVPAL